MAFLDYPNSPWWLLDELHLSPSDTVLHNFKCTCAVLEKNGNADVDVSTSCSVFDNWATVTSIKMHIHVHIHIPYSGAQRPLHCGTSAHFPTLVQSPAGGGGGGKGEGLSHVIIITYVVSIKLSAPTKCSPPFLGRKTRKWRWAFSRYFTVLALVHSKALDNFTQVPAIVCPHCICEPPI